MTTTLAFYFTGTGLLLIALGVPLMRRRVRPNDYYGLRVAATFADESVWYDANAQSGRDLIVVGAAVVTLAVVLATLPLPELMYFTVNLVAMLAGVIGFGIIGWRRANRLLAERHSPRGRS